MTEFEQRFEKTLDNLKSKFLGVRTGRANPDLLASIRVDYYGSMLPLQQLANVSVSEGNTLLVNVFDSGAVSAIEKALQASDLGLNPQVDGAIIRLRLPDLTEDRREELVRYVKKIAEEKLRYATYAVINWMPLNNRICRMMNRNVNQMMSKKSWMHLFR